MTAFSTVQYRITTIHAESGRETAIYVWEYNTKAAVDRAYEVSEKCGDECYVDLALRAPNGVWHGVSRDEWDAYRHGIAPALAYIGKDRVIVTDY